MGIRKNYIILGVIFGLCTSGCASLDSLTKNRNVESEFDCPAQQGFGCASIDEVRSRIVTSGTPQVPIYNTAGPETSVTGVPSWTPDVVLKVHIGDFVDSHGNYHDNSTIYVVARNGGWEVE